MGKPSARKRSAQRLGKRERALVKRHRRAQAWLNVGGGETVHVKAGQKKMDRHYKWFAKTHLSVAT